MTLLETLKAATKPLTIPQAAEMLGVHKITAYRWAEHGKLPVMRIGGCLRIDPQALADWLSARSV